MNIENLIDENYRFLDDNIIPKNTKIIGNADKLYINKCYNKLDFSELVCNDMICEKGNINTIGILPDSLKNLVIFKDNLTIIPFNLPPLLKGLNCNDNNLKELPKLPNSLEYLSCNNNNLKELPELPNSLKILKLSKNMVKELPDTLPSNLEFLNISFNLIDNIKNLPDSIEILVINGNKNLNKINKLPNNIVKFSSNIKHIEDISNFDKINIKSLSINSILYSKIKDIIPSSLKYINIDGLCENIDIDHLPNGIEELYFFSFNNKINKFPDNLKILELSYYDQNIINKIPKNIEYLYLLYRNKFNYNNLDLPNLKILFIRSNRTNIDNINIKNMLPIKNDRTITFISYQFLYDIIYNNKEIDRKILKSIESPDLYHFIQDKMNLSKLYKNKTVKSCN